MKKRKVIYTDEPMGEVRIIENFLPPPEHMIFKKDDTVKVTLSLTSASVAFFKKEAKQHHTQYQKMIRILLDEYVSHHIQAA